MEYLRKHLPQAGLVYTLLIVGILVGLLAPLPSGAVPTVTLKVDSGTATSILTTGTCPVETGYTACYRVNTALTVVGAGATPAGTPNRSYLVRNAPGATARLRVADLAGQDKLSLVGVIFVPAPAAGQTVANWNTATNTTANTSETHKLTITISNVFDSATANTTNAGNYVWAMRAGGEFRAGPTAAGACAGAACNTIGNSVTFPGTGTFSPTLVNRNILSPSGKNTQPLSFTVAGPTNPIVSFNGLTNATLGQENPTYPTFLCDTNGTTAGGACRPSITEVMTVTLKGPDSFVLVNGGDGIGASCAATLTDRQQKQIALLTWLVGFLDQLEQRHPNAKLRDFIIRMQTFLARVNIPQDPGCLGARLVDLDFALNAAIDQVAFAADGAVPAEPALTSTITIRKVTSEATSDSFQFTLIGPSASADETIDMEGQTSRVIVIPVEPGNYSLTEIPRAGWDLTNVTCSGGQINLSLNLALGDNVDCTFTNSLASASNAVLHIEKELSTSCGGSCAPVTFGFQIVGPQNSTPLVTTDGFGRGITSVPLPAGTYSVVEDTHSSFGLQNSFCSVDGGAPVPTTDVEIPSGASVTCIFVNEPL